MKISSVRYKAFATNSSSVHTPIIFTGKTPEDFLADGGFGTQGFIAASEKAKRKYAAIALVEALRCKGNNWLAEPDASMIATVQKWTGVRGTSWSTGYLDHQSLPIIPCAYDGKGPSKKYFDDYLAWLLQDHLVMTGGSDQETKGEWPKRDRIKGKRLVKPYPVEGHASENYVCRFDPKGFYTIMDKKHGTKIRMSFSDKTDMSKSTYPELVDLKITNRCSRGCSYCYQNSSPVGKHADPGKVYAILKALSSLEVLEVAFGGGEPTSNPWFWSFVEKAHELGITPNFSTRKLHWLANPRYRRIFLRCCGAFAFSVDKLEDIERLAKSLEGEAFKETRSEQKATIQLVVKPELKTNDLVKMIDKASELGFNTTLLGFKTVGRGEKYLQFHKKNKVNWDKVFKSTSCYYLNVDTAFIQQHKEALKREEIAPWSYDIKEGTHSMYIDAVNMEMGPSSYSGARTPFLSVEGHTKIVVNTAFEIVDTFRSCK